MVPEAVQVAVQTGIPFIFESNDGFMWNFVARKKKSGPKTLQA